MRHANKFMSGMLSSILTLGLTTTPAGPATEPTAPEADPVAVPAKDGGSDEDAEPPDTSRPAPRVHVPATASLAVETAPIKVTPAPEPAPPDPVQFTGDAASWENGRLPEHALCPIEHAPWHAARCDAAAATDRLNAAFRATFGRDLTVTDSYRTLEQQITIRAAKGHMAAPPGTSNHGWGIALDLGGGIETFGTVEHEWMRANAGAFGWIHPDWAQAHGTKPEPWHWEYKVALP